MKMAITSKTGLSLKLHDIEQLNTPYYTPIHSNMHDLQGSGLCIVLENGPKDALHQCSAQYFIAPLHSLALLCTILQCITQCIALHRLESQRIAHFSSHIIASLYTTLHLIIMAT